MQTRFFSTKLRKPTKKNCAHIFRA